MVLGMGLDLVSVERFRRFLQRRGERALQRLFTPGERKYCRGHVDPAQSLAARFAAKEALFKALGTGMGPGGGWHDVEVTRLASGKPELLLHGRAAELATELRVRAIHLSLSHSGDTAGAVVVLEA